MRKVILTLMFLTVSLSATGQEARRGSSPGGAAGYAARNATVLSVMGWGFLLAGGIATACLLVESSHSH